MAEAVHTAYTDDNLLVLHKPAGLLCVPGRGPDKQDCLSARVQQRWPGALIVHRLDQATSGLVVMARNLATQRSMSHAFAERQVHKRYHAVVQGLMGTTHSDWSEIDLPIAADWERRPLRVIDHAVGKPSLTRWRVLAYSPTTQTTRVELQPVTGRTHQLRVHLAAAGHPIVGDALYADATTQALSARLLLHACHLAFTHPVTGEQITLDCAPNF